MPVALPELRAILPPTWRLVTEDELGELSLEAVLEGTLGDAGRGLAAGWRGDRYQVWEDADGRLALIYRVQWDGEEPAQAFARSYARLLEKKHAGLAGTALKGPGSRWSWRDGRHAFAVEQRGPEVLILERVPADRVEPLRRALGTSSALPAR